MTGMSDVGWKAAADAGAHVSVAAPIEMHMRHGMPPIQKAIDLGVSLSLSSDVECTMTADMFTQMRGVLTLQRMLANELALRARTTETHVRHGHPEARDDRGAKVSRSTATGSLTPGKDADIILLDATALNVAPLNHASRRHRHADGRSNVSTSHVRRPDQEMAGRDGRLRHSQTQGRARGEPRPRVRRGWHRARSFAGVNGAFYGRGMHIASNVEREPRGDIETAAPPAAAQVTCRALPSQ